jgi:hypothetical protein
MQGTTTAQGSNGSAWDSFILLPPQPEECLKDIKELPALSLFDLSWPQNSGRRKDYAFVYWLPAHYPALVWVSTNINQEGFIKLSPNELRTDLFYNGRTWKTKHTRWPDNRHPNAETDEWKRFRMTLNERIEAMVHLGESLQVCPNRKHFRKMSLLVDGQDLLWWYCNATDKCKFAAPVDHELSRVVHKHTSPGFWNEMR